MIAVGAKSFADSLLIRKYTHLSPAVPKRPDANRHVRRALHILDLQQLILLSKRQEVCKEGIKVRLRAEVQNLGIMRVVDVCKYAQELAVNVLHGRRE